MAKPDTALEKALELLEQGDWQGAHVIVQAHENAYACWLHGIVHTMENDLDNARYWYKRANRAFSSDVSAELAAARSSQPA